MAAKSLKIFFIFALIFSYRLTLNPCPLIAQDKVVAIVNKDVITQSDLNNFIDFMRMQLSAELKGKELEDRIQSMKLNLLNKLIDDRLILQEAKNEKIQIDEGRVKDKIEEIKKGFSSGAEFQKNLTRQGMVESDLEARIRDQLLTHNIIELKVKSKVVVRPYEVTDFYEKNKEEFKTLWQREFESLSMKNEELAKDVSLQIRQGASFEDISKKYALEINKVIISEGELKKDIEDTLFNLKINEISKPVKTEDAFYIFKLVNIIMPRQQNLNEVQDDIYNYLLERKMQEGLKNWLDEIKKRSYVKILSD